MKNKYSQEEFIHNLKYEIDMLNYSYAMISLIERYLQKADSPKEHQQAAKNAMMEAFCIHARLLIEFFTTKRTRINSAENFCNSYHAKEFPSKKPIFAQLLNNQVAHFMENRIKSNATDKIDDAKRFEIIKWLHIEVKKFKECCAGQKIEIVIPDVDTDMVVSILEKSTTNHITSISLQNNARLNIDKSSKIFKFNTNSRS